MKGVVNKRPCALAVEGVTDVCPALGRAPE
jgi:hypothetical protein